MGFLVLAAPVVALLALAPDRALRSRRWYAGAAVSGLGAVATHGLMAHAYVRGGLASAVNVVHFGAVALWLGGLAVLAVVVLPRRRADELAALVPRWSRFAFAAVVTAVVAGGALLVLISPRWTALPGSGYGRLLALKLALVVGLLVAAARARRFVRQRLPLPLTPDIVDLTVAEPEPARQLVPVGVAADPAIPSTDSDAVQPTSGGPGPAGVPVPVDGVPLRPLVTAVTAELCLAASILAATAVLVGRPPPS